MTARERADLAEQFAAIVETIMATESESAKRLLRSHALVFGHARFKTWLHAEKAAGRRRTPAPSRLRARSSRRQP
jgi:hypothetical protein